MPSRQGDAPDVELLEGLPQLERGPVVAVWAFYDARIGHPLQMGSPSVENEHLASPLQIGAELVFRNLLARCSANRAHECELLGSDQRLLAENHTQPNSRKTVQRVVAGVAATLAGEGERSRPFYEVRFPPCEEQWPFLLPVTRVGPRAPSSGQPVRL